MTKLTLQLTPLLLLSCTPLLAMQGASSALAKACAATVSSQAATASAPEALKLAPPICVLDGKIFTGMDASRAAMKLAFRDTYTPDTRALLAGVGAKLAAERAASAAAAAQEAARWEKILPEAKDAGLEQLKSLRDKYATVKAQADAKLTASCIDYRAERHDAARWGVELSAEYRDAVKREQAQLEAEVASAEAKVSVAEAKIASLTKTVVDETDKR